MRFAASAGVMPSASASAKRPRSVSAIPASRPRSRLVPALVDERDQVDDAARVDDVVRGEEDAALVQALGVRRARRAGCSRRRRPRGSRGSGIVSRVEDRADRARREDVDLDAEHVVRRRRSRSRSPRRAPRRRRSRAPARRRPRARARGSRRRRRRPGRAPRGPARSAEPKTCSTVARIPWKTPRAVPGPLSPPLADAP